MAQACHTPSNALLHLRAAGWHKLFPGGTDLKRHNLIKKAPIKQALAGNDVHRMMCIVGCPLPQAVAFASDSIQYHWSREQRELQMVIGAAERTTNAIC